ncbi:MAG: exosortase system-associated protein, TIGR04073 family [Candidatus Omnitrophica bacterium]|nr:exosortase system-associated protein, TIGR04073 family [Candidatus Omnitrophota bacterium]
MRSMIWTAVIFGIVMGSTTPVFAQDPIHKLGRGVSNVLTCWVELPKHFSMGMQEDNPLLGIGGGVLKGTGLMFTRFAVGAYEAVSFLVPFPKDYASPYEGMELQDYAWE